jgi:hypothetical protein
LSRHWYAYHDRTVREGERQREKEREKEKKRDERKMKEKEKIKTGKKENHWKSKVYHSLTYIKM